MAITKQYNKVAGKTGWWTITFWMNGTPADKPRPKLVKKTYLQSEKADIEARLAEIPMSDQQLIDWAKANHPVYEHRARLQERLDDINQDLSNMT